MAEITTILINGGQPGITGSQIYIASGAPAPTLGANSDIYLNSANGDMYQKSAGTWTLSGNFSGGSIIFSDSGAPANGIGSDTDFYVDSDTGNFYIKTSGVWVLQGQLAGGALRFVGTWNASTNTPTLASGTGTEGSIYIVSNTGGTTLDGISSWAVTDWAVFLNGAWRKIDNSSGSSIIDADIDVSAAIARSKLASGNNYRVVINGATGVMTDAAAITASRALVSDANGIPTHSATTATELGYVNGVTSAIQTQLNGKEPTITTLPETKGGTNQSTYATGDTLYASGANTLSKRTIGSAGQILKVVGGVPAWENMFYPAGEIHLYDDFMNGPAGTLGWNTMASGAGAAESSTLTHIDANHPGVLQLSTGTTTTGRSGRTLGGANGAFVSGVVLGGGAISQEWLVRIEDLATVAEDYNLFAGMQETVTGITAGVYFAYQRNTLGGNWHAITRASSVSEETDTGVAVVEDAWIKLRIEINAAGTSIQFYIDGSLVATNTLNIPSIPIAPIFRVTKAGGTTARLFFCDYFRHYQRFTSAR